MAEINNLKESKMRHNRNEIEERYDEIKKQIEKKVKEYKHTTMFIQSTCFPYFCTIDNKWKTKTTIHR